MDAALENGEEVRATGAKGNCGILSLQGKLLPEEILGERAEVNIDAQTAQSGAYTEQSTRIGSEDEETFAYGHSGIARDGDARKLDNGVGDELHFSVADANAMRNELDKKPIVHDFPLDAGGKLASQNCGVELAENNSVQVAQSMLTVVEVIAGAEVVPEPMAVRSGRRELSIQESEPGENMQMTGNNADIPPVLDSAKELSELQVKEATSACGSKGKEKAGENAGVGEGHDEKLGLSVAELVAKARAPVKKEFLTTATVRLLAPNGSVKGAGSNNGVGDDNESGVVGERKSKRQMRRERLQAKKSTENICTIVAQTGDVKQCPYGAHCRFNHDLEGYKTQKPPDLPGKCPFLDFGEPCPYGIACRFAASHEQSEGYDNVPQKRSYSIPNEGNGLNKDLQRVLWKNMGSFPKADAQLKAMGLMTKAFKMRKGDGEDKESHDVDMDINDGLSKCNQTPSGIESALATLTTTGVINERQDFPGIRNLAEDSNNKDDGILKADVMDSHVSKLESMAPTSPVLSHIVEQSSPPQKRLRTEADVEIKDNEMEVATKENKPGEVSPSSAIALDTETTETSSVIALSTGELVLPKDSVNHGPSVDSNESLYVESKLGVREKKLIDFREKLYLAPLTTVGNLPFRRVCKALGADITCGEMAMCTNLLQGQASEWALLRRHTSEDLFGVQICGSFPDHVARVAELIEQECQVDFIDINMGCPIDLVVSKGAGSCLLTKPQRLEHIVRATAAVMENPLTIKVRMGYYEGKNCAHTLMPNLSSWGVNAVTIHGRTRQQRYSKLADWAYVQQCAAGATGNLQVIGNGDVLSYTDWNEQLKQSRSKLSTCMIARGALIKPWLFVEIKEERHWDISSGERLDILRQYVHAGLTHWGSDSKGVETTRHFLLEWLSYMHRYIPVGVLEVVPQHLNWRPPSYFGRNDLETLMASESAADWVRISELLLGPTPAHFMFKPKHKSNAYDRPENG